MNGIGIKEEEGPTFKSEMEGYPSTNVDDDDEYEDTGELAMPPTGNGLWLSRVPDYLWEALSTLNDDDEIKIGTMRIWNKPDGEKVKLDLDERREFQEVPKAYDLRVVNDKAKNTYVFSEKNQPGYKSQSAGQKRAFFGAGSESGPDSKRRKQMNTEQTTLVGPACHEVNCVALENAEYRRLMDERMRKLFQPKHTTRFLQPDQQNEARLLYNSQKSQMQGFIVPAAWKPKKSQENKNVRISQEDLIPWLIDLFTEYKYWPMKQLRVRTKQPETFLRDTLQEIAYMVKSGPFSNLWTLKEEYVTNLPEGTNIKEERPPDDEEEEEDDANMEEVKLER
ncbi:MAG: hypothetical protein Q9157_006206 [Trypethelium eluteriae]